ncbi:unnamed protein product [Miscanthus lutarioriparius]|uniref:Prolamin-like domain-containing protein n=1 Tax=Miscanthus lutarioriparius TaxID=422564 RepID=A0A811MV31_9POAL|nr:unnamed protein product [Miscanthus lutarioriparius]
MAFSRLSMSALTFLALLAASTAAHRTPPTAFAPSSSPSVRGLPALAERLEGAEAQLCWEALVEIKSCKGEIIILFIKGEAFLGPGCCRAIRLHAVLHRFHPAGRRHAQGNVVLELW